MNKKDLNAISQKVNSLIREDNFEKAIELLNLLITEDPNNYFLKMNLGACYKNINNFEKAIEIYKDAMNHPNKDCEVFYNLGNLYFAQKNHNESLKYYDKAILEDNSHIKARINRCVALLSLKKYSDAYIESMKLYEVYPNDFTLNISISTALSFLNKFNEALPFLEKCLKAKPSNKGVRSLASIIYNHLGRKNEGIKNLSFADGVIVFYDDKDQYEIINEEKFIG